MHTFLFTSDSVNEGHPDKLCDQVSEAILDSCLEQDPESKVACETCTKTNMLMIFGEITTKANIDYEKIVRGTPVEEFNSCQWMLACVQIIARSW